MAKRKYHAPFLWRRWLLSAVVVVVCLTALGLGGYTLWLDREVRAHFKSARWALPAHVYARPLEIYQGLHLTENQLRKSLKRLGYRRAQSVSGPGTYSVDGDTLSLESRAFTFWDGHQDAQSARVHFGAAGVAQLIDPATNKQLALVRLDPLLIGSIYPAHGADRILVRLDHVPPLLTKGLVAVEDRGFYSNIGIDFKAIARALLADIRAGHIVQGGSTLTQQLVKNFFLGNRRTLWRKFNEAIMAVLLEVHYSKRDILGTYLNEVYLGQDGSRSIRGFGLASYFYFNKPLSELEPQEVALLVGLVKGPSYYDPRRHPKRAKARRNLVLQIFGQQGVMPSAEAKRDERKPLDVVATPDESTTQYPAFVDLVRRQLLGQYREQDLTSEGLRIFTTLDPRIQANTEQEVSRGLSRLEQAHGLGHDTLQSAAVVASAQSGDVLALVAGRHPRFAGFNRALDAHRQVGSLLKPAVYLTALEHPYRYTLITDLKDEPISVPRPNGPPWRPRNYERVFHGEVPLYSALAHSYNVATVRLGMKLGVGDVVDTLTALGLDQPPAPLPSLLLGAVNLSPLQVAQIYNTFASGGFYNPLLAIKAVTTQHGRPLKRYPLEIKPAVAAGPLYLDTWAMEQVLRIGTARSAYDVLPNSLTLAGKTGTTDDLRDSWFAGFGANLETVVWVGRDDNQSTHLTGATGALQIWSRIMRDNGVQGLDADPPSNVTLVRVLPGRDQRADGHCSGAIEVPFIRGSAPQQRATCAGGNKAHRVLDWLRGLF